MKFEKFFNFDLYTNSRICVAIQLMNLAGKRSLANGCVSKLGKLHKFVASCAFEREVVDFNLQRFLVEECLAAMAAMPHELKVKTLEGGVVTIEVMQRTTIRELKAMLHEQNIVKILLNAKSSK